jgi:anti-sigma regulatory factor (Ser/Thr protein kinase)
MKLSAEIGFLHVATGFVEQSAVAMGLTAPDSMALTLATEEIFVYLCRTSAPDRELEIRCSGGGYFVRADFFLPVEDFNLRAFNVTATISPDDDACLEEMGLFIASREVDRFQVLETAGGGIRLSLIKGKTYPVPGDFEMPPGENLETYALRRPDAEDAKLFVAMVNKTFPPVVTPRSFARPGKVVDMLALGHYEAVVAFGPSGRIGGGIVWRWSGPRTVEFFGPYLFNQQPGSAMAEDLLDACIGAIAKTHAVALINRLPTEFLPRQRFEMLGSLNVCASRGAVASQPTYFRQMHEDSGCTVKSHPDLVGFLQREYDRLFLPREVQPVGDAGERQTPYSVIAADFDRGGNMATLRPIRAGADVHENVKNHVDLFRRESIGSLFFELDLAMPWQVGFTPALVKNGFAPRLILPYAGQGDLVVFQWEEERP